MYFRGIPIEQTGVAICVRSRLPPPADFLRPNDPSEDLAPHLRRTEGASVRPQLQPGNVWDLTQSPPGHRAISTSWLLPPELANEAISSILSKTSTSPKLSPNCDTWFFGEMEIIQAMDRLKNSNTNRVRLVSQVH